MLKTSAEIDVHKPFAIAGVALSDTCTSESENSKPEESYPSDTSTTLHGSSGSCEQPSPVTLSGDEVDCVIHKFKLLGQDPNPPIDESDESDCSQAGRPESRSSFLTAKSEFSD